MSTSDRIQKTAARIRRRVLDYTLRNNGGYLSQACSSAEIFATMYLEIMNLGASVAPMIPMPFPGVPGANNPQAFTGGGYNGPRCQDLDRFFISPVHYALVLYSTLIEVGRMAPEGLEMFNKDGSTVELIGAEHSPGHELTAGSLAQCLSQAGGISLARKIRGESGRNWVFMSDGEFEEGQTWEAFAALAYHRVDNIGVYVDVNGQQCDGPVTSVMNIEPLATRLDAFGARVFDVDGHNPKVLADPASMVPDGRPLVVLARTDPCCGIALLKKRAPKLHYVRFKSEEEQKQYEAALLEMKRTEGEG